MNPGWAGGAIAWIVQRAAHLAPRDLCPRLEEEWLADLSAYADPMQRLRFALGCCWAALSVRGETFAAGGASPRRAMPAGTTSDDQTRCRKLAIKLPFARRRDRLREEALAWVARLRRGLRAEEGSELREWLKRRSHRARIARAAAESDSAETLALLSGIFSVDPEWVEPPRRRSGVISGGAALVALFIAAVPLVLTHHYMPGVILGAAREGSFMETMGTVYANGRHALRRVDAADGTRIVMNRGSRVVVLDSQYSRSALLVRGEATFTVPHQPLRPFDLTVGDRHFNTSEATFDVRLTGRDAMEITVLDGTMTLLPSRASSIVDPLPTVLRAPEAIDIGPGNESARTLSELEAQARIGWHRE